MKIKTLTLLGLAVLGIGSALSASAAETLSTSDADFLRKAAVAGMAEVEQSKAALQLSSNDKTKSFAQMMVTDHGKANDELSALAKKNGWTIPAELDGDAQKKVGDVRGAGAQVDTVYAHNMVKDHDEAVALFSNAATNVTAPSLRSFAQEKLPTLQQHSKKAKELPGAAK